MGWILVYLTRLRQNPRGAKRDRKTHRFPIGMELTIQGKEFRLYSVAQGEPSKLLRRGPVWLGWSFLEKPSGNVWQGVKLEAGRPDQTED